MAERPEDQEREGLSLARSAEINAELRVLGRARTAEILSRAGVRADDWENANASWKAAIDADFDGKAGLLLAFATRFRETRKRLSSAPASGGAETPGPVPEVDAGVPTYRLAPPLTSPAPIAAAGSPWSSFAAPPSLDIRSAVSTLLPIEPGKSATQASASTSNRLAGTTEFDVRRLLPTVLPFDPASASAPRAAFEEQPERRERNPVRVQSELGGTADLDIHHIVSKLLPFGARAAPTLESSRPAPAPPPVGAPELPSLTLGQYASLTAEIAASPERAAETRAKYGVPTEQAYRGLNTLWEQRFAENSALQERWIRLVGEYRAWLQQR